VGSWIKIDRKKTVRDCSFIQQGRLLNGIKLRPSSNVITTVQRLSGCGRAWVCIFDSLCPSWFNVHMENDLHKENIGPLSCFLVHGVCHLRRKRSSRMEFYSLGHVLYSCSCLPSCLCQLSLLKSSGL
jgi:hypothetical protein